MWNNLSVPDKNIYASVTPVPIVIVDWSVDKQAINFGLFLKCNVVSVVHKITFWIMSIIPIKFTLYWFFPFLSNVFGKMHYVPLFLFCYLTPDGYSSWGVLDTQCFNYCLACFYTLIKHKKGGKFADFNEMYQELEQNIPTLTYYVFYHVLSTWIYVIYV